MKNGVEKFIETQEDKGLNGETIKKYVSDIDKFYKFIRLKEDKELEELTGSEIKSIFNDYIKALEREKYKPSTINGKIIIINKYLKFLGIESSHKYIKIQKKMYIENVINYGEYMRLLEQCKENKRDEVIMKTFVNTGLRVSELLSLTIQDVNSRTVYVKGKGGKYREIILSPSLRELLKDYIKNYRLKTDKKILFTGKFGALTRNAINKMLLKYAQKARVKKSKAHPHAFRHYFGKRLAEDGVSLDVIQTYLGHENIATTSIYTKRSKDELEKSLERKYI